MNNNLYNFNQSEEEDINLFDIFIELLKHWRLIIITTVVAAILVSGLKYMKDSSTIEITKTDKTISMQELQKKLTDDEQSALSQAEIVKNQLEEKKNYQSNSVLMNIKPYEKNSVILQYYIDTNYTYNLTSDITKDYGSELVNAYTSYIQNNGVLDTVCDKLEWKIDDAYVAELISAGEVSFNDKDSSIFMIYLTGINKKSVNELADIIIEEIENYQPILTKKIGKHELTLIERGESVVADDGLANRQISLEDSIISLQNKLNTLKQNFSEEQLKVFSGEEAETEDNAMVTITRASISKKYILLGAFVGIFLSCLWVALCYIFSNRLKSSKEVQEKYGIRIFGDIFFGEKKKRFLSVIDNWVDFIQHKEKYSLEEQKDLIITNLKMTCNKENIQHLFLTTSISLNEEEKTLIDMVISNLRDSDIKVTFGKNIIRNTKSLEEMVEISNVVLIEKVRESVYTNLHKELLLCKEQKASVLGIIVME